jgi:hypothetical protein
MAAIMVAPVRLLVHDIRHAAYAEALATAGGPSGTSVTSPPDHSAPADAAFTAEDVTIDAGGHSLAVCR